MSIHGDFHYEPNDGTYLPDYPGAAWHKKEGDDVAPVLVWYQHWMAMAITHWDKNAPFPKRYAGSAWYARYATAHRKYVMSGKVRYINPHNFGYYVYYGELVENEEFLKFIQATKAGSDQRWRHQLLWDAFVSTNPPQFIVKCAKDAYFGVYPGDVVEPIELGKITIEHHHKDGSTEVFDADDAPPAPVLSNKKGLVGL